MFLKIIDALVDDGFIVVDNFLEKDLLKDLKKEFEDKRNFKQAGISASNDLHIDNNRRRDKILWLDTIKESESRYLNIMDELQQNLNRYLYLGIQYYEAHFAMYSYGDFYEKHLDSFKNFKNRVVTTVFYLNNCEGGDLVIYDNDGNIVSTIQPQENRLVVFLSEKFPHEVKIVKSQRYSIAGWFRIDKKLY